MPYQNLPDALEGTEPAVSSPSSGDELRRIERGPRTRRDRIADGAVCLLPVAFGAAAILEYLYVPSLPGASLTWTYVGFMGILVGCALAAFVASCASERAFEAVRHRAPFLSLVFALFCAYDVLTVKTGRLPLPYFPWVDQILNAAIRDADYLLDCIKNSLILLFTGYAWGLATGLLTGIACGYSKRVSYWVDPFLGHDGVDINTVDWKVVTTDAVAQAMQNGEIDAAILSDQFAKKFVDAGTLRVVRSLTFDSDYQQEPCCIVAFNSDFIAENPVTAKKFTRAFRNASLWINENKSDALDLMFENNWASGDKDAAFEIMSDFNFDMSEELTRKALLSIIEDYKKYGIITATDDAETLLGKVWAPVLGDEA